MLLVTNIESLFLEILNFPFILLDSAKALNVPRFVRLPRQDPSSETQTILAGFQFLILRNVDAPAEFGVATEPSFQ
jgi:hypothetical protein